MGISERPQEGCKPGRGKRAGTGGGRFQDWEGGIPAVRHLQTEAHYVRPSTSLVGVYQGFRGADEAAFVEAAPRRDSHWEQGGTVRGF